MNWRLLHENIKDRKIKRLTTGKFGWKEADMCCALGTCLIGENLDHSNFPLRMGAKIIEKILDATGTDLNYVSIENDSFSGTPEERYEYMLAWTLQNAEELGE